MKDALTSIDIHHDFVDVPGNTRVNLQVIDQDGNHTEINEPGFKISDSDFLRFLERVEQYLDDKNHFCHLRLRPSLLPHTKFCKAY